MAASLLACAPGEPAPPAHAAIIAGRPPRERPGYIIDSIVPIDEALGRFRVGLAPVSALEGGVRSRDGLVRAFAQAVERRDRASLRRMVLSRAEFAYLVYPSSPYTRPPYRQQPEVAWLLHHEPSAVGLARLTARLGGRPLGYRGYTCDAEPIVEGANRLWRGCRVSIRRPDGRTEVSRLFGVILERGGRFKFASYANDL